LIWELTCFGIIFFEIKQRVCLKRSCFIHYSLKKIPKQCRFEHVYLLLPLTCKGKGKRFFFHSYATSISPFLSLPFTQKTPTPPTPPHGPPPWWKRLKGQALRAALERLHKDSPSHPTPVPWLDKGSSSISPFPLL
jgi:hypothetical protein